MKKIFLLILLYFYPERKREIYHKLYKIRWDKAWSIACYKAKGYHELIDACSPWYYFFSEYYGLRKTYPKSWLI